MPHCHVVNPQVLRYSHNGEQIHADTKSEAHRLIRNRLKFVCRLLFLRITASVHTFPMRPRKNRSETSTVITTLTL